MMLRTRSKPAGLWGTLRAWVAAERLQQHEEKVLLVLTLIIGATVGVVVVAFILLTENLGSRLYPAGGAAWRRVIIPVLGALITGFLLKRYFPNARGSGIPQTKTALFIHGGLIRMRTVLGKFGCSSVSLASGIALGREGPSVQVGAGIASSLGRQLGLSPSTTKALVPIGASAALAAAFNTPIAAVLFTLEEIMGDLHAPVLGSIVFSSATSWIVLHLFLGDEPLFHVPAYHLVHPVELGLYALLGVLGGLVSIAFVKLLLWLRKNFLRMPAWSESYQPVVGGLVVGLFGWVVPAVLGVGYNHVSEALNGQLVLKMMALLVVLKLVATATCYASGNAGGIFGPSLFIGAMMGGAFGGLAHQMLPDYTGGVGAYALVGMGAAFAGIVRVPFTSVIMIFEVTRDYSIIVPLMICNLMSYFISSRLQKEPIYEALLSQDRIHLPVGARGREELLPVREGTSLAAKTLPAASTVEAALAAGATDSERNAFPVVDENGLLGMVSVAQLREAVRQGRGGAPLAELLPQRNPHSRLTTADFPHVYADQPLDTALRRMAQSGLNVLPVVSRTNVRQLVGTISLHDALAAYGLGKKTIHAERPDTPAPQAAPTGPRGLLAVAAVLLVLAGFLTYYYRTQRAMKAGQYLQTANKLMQENQYQEAVEQYRKALSISHSPEYRLALGLALLKAGALNEAQIYLREVLRADPNTGPANLALARIAVQQGKLRDALECYRVAIPGSWPPDAQGDRLEARIELVDVFKKLGQQDQAQAELLRLLGETPADDVSNRKRLGHLLLNNDLPKQAASLYQRILAKHSRDADAHTGLGEAEFLQGNYRATADQFKAALRLNPADETAQSRLRVTEEILGLDPTLRGLTSAERYGRSQKLLEATLRALEQCMATSKNPLPAPAAEHSDAARKALLAIGKPASYGDATEDHIALAQKLWDERVTTCGPPPPSDEPIARVMARVAK